MRALRRWVVLVALPIVGLAVWWSRPEPTVVAKCGTTSWEGADFQIVSFNITKGEQTTTWMCLAKKDEEADLDNWFLVVDEPSFLGMTFNLSGKREVSYWMNPGKSSHIVSRRPSITVDGIRPVPVRFLGESRLAGVEDK
jgi:hypothetical protein